MTPDEILAALAHLGDSVPAEALAAADLQRAALTPRLLDSLAELVAHPATAVADDLSQVPFFAMYLLAAWREPRAHPLLLALLRLPDEQGIEISGDIVTEDMDRLLAQTAGNNPDGVLALVRDPTLSVWARTAGFRALAVMTEWGILPRAEFVARCHELLATLGSEPEPDDAEVMLSTLVGSAARLGIREVRDACVALAAEDWVDPLTLGGADEVAAEFDRVGKPAPVLPIEQVSAAVSWWGGFCARPAVDPAWQTPADVLLPDERADAVSVPYRAPPKVGRNDPCPCGSGKKYKKCCGA